jgi:hypothetical protein
MNRLIVIVACLALSSAACKKSTEAPPAEQPAQPAAAAPAAGPSAAEPAAPALDPKTIVFTDEMVQKYVEYQKENLALARQYAAQSKKNLESSKGDTSKVLNQVSLSQQYSKEMDAKLEAKRQALGLSKEQFDLLQDAARTLATGRALYNQMGGDAQLAKMEAEQKAQLAKMAPEQRAAAEAEMGVFSKNLRDMRDGIDLRKKYGDKNADVMLKYADTLAKDMWDAMKEMGTK